MEMENLAKGEVDNNKNPESNQSAMQEEEINNPENQVSEAETGTKEKEEAEEENVHADHKDKKKHKKSSAKEIESLKQEVGELKDKYLRLYSEFENFRRRTSKEKLDLIKTASEEIVLALLPVIDDFERAIKALSESEADSNNSVDGIQLIYNKLKYIIEQRGLKVMNINKGDDFNSEIHEAITKIPVDDENLKGKIVEVVEKGYHLHDKVIRFAKVITGS